MSRVLAVALLLAGCTASTPPGNLAFAPVDDLSALAGTYRNRGEGGSATTVFLASLLWPNDAGLDASRVETIEVGVDGPDTRSGAGT